MSELWVPVARLQPILAMHKGTKEHLSETVVRRMHRIKSGRQEFVSLNVVDKMLLELDLDLWLRLPREQGGLADIYEDEQQYGNPNSRPNRSEAEKRRRRNASKYRWQAKRPRVQVRCSGCDSQRLLTPEYAAKAALTVCVPCSNRGLVAA